jgi:hypothetical protein
MRENPGGMFEVKRAKKGVLACWEGVETELRAGKVPGCVNMLVEAGACPLCFMGRVVYPPGNVSPESGVLADPNGPQLERLRQNFPPTTIAVDRYLYFRVLVKLRKGI